MLILYILRIVYGAKGQQGGAERAENDPPCTQMGGVWEATDVFGLMWTSDKL